MGADYVFLSIDLRFNFTFSLTIFHNKPGDSVWRSNVSVDHEKELLPSKSETTLSCVAVCLFVPAEAVLLMRLERLDDVVHGQQRCSIPENEQPVDHW